MLINLVSCSIFLMLSTLGHAVDRRNLMMKPKGTMKTIKCIETGDVIDCVDYYQQPAFHNRAVNSSKVHLSHYRSGLKTKNSSKPSLVQMWHKYGLCPEGTVPILRGRSNRISRKYPISRGRKNRTIQRHPNDNLEDHEYATVFQHGGTFKGGAATFNVWNPYTESDELSLSQIWVSAKCDIEEPEFCNVVEAGWIVNPEQYGDKSTRFFVFFTNDNYQHTNCYDTECNNFALLPNANVAPGAAVRVSEFGKDKQQEVAMDIKISKDEYSDLMGYWVITVNGQPIGHWTKPDGKDLFDSLRDHADEVEWGGEITNKRTNEGKHTITEMGNGYFPKSGMASYFRSCRVRIGMDWKPATFNGYVVTDKNCYTIEKQGSFFYYGGNGGNSGNGCE